MFLLMCVAAGGCRSVGTTSLGDQQCAMSAERWRSCQILGNQRQYTDEQLTLSPVGGEGSRKYQAVYSKYLCDYTKVPTEVTTVDAFSVLIADPKMSEHILQMAVRSCKCGEVAGVPPPQKEVQKREEGIEADTTRMRVYCRATGRVMCSHDRGERSSAHDSNVSESLDQIIELIQKLRGLQ